MSEVGIGTLELSEEMLRRMLRARRVREQQLGKDLFADPAWDILLEALAAELGQRRNRIDDLTKTAAVPKSTALRWIKKLEEDGWLELEADPLERDRSWIKLTSCGSRRLRHYFDAIGSALLLV